jgi:hypothetical protein
LAEVAVRDALGQLVERGALPGERLQVQFVGAQRGVRRADRVRPVLLLAGIGGIVGVATQLTWSPLAALTLVLYLFVLFMVQLQLTLRRRTGVAAVGITDRRVLVVGADGNREPKVIGEWPRHQLQSVQVDRDPGSWPTSSYLRVHLAESPAFELHASNLGAVEGLRATLRLAGVRVLDGSGALTGPESDASPLQPPVWPALAVRLRSCLTITAALMGGLLGGMVLGSLVDSAGPANEAQQCREAVAASARSTGLRLEAVGLARSDTSATFEGAALEVSPDGDVSAVAFSCYRDTTGTTALFRE